MEMQLTLFEECQLDDDSGKCKDLSDAIEELNAAVAVRKKKPKTDECEPTPTLPAAPHAPQHAALRTISALRTRLDACGTDTPHTTHRHAALTWRRNCLHRQSTLISRWVPRPPRRPPPSCATRRRSSARSSAARCTCGTPERRRGRCQDRLGGRLGRPGATGAGTGGGTGGRFLLLRTCRGYAPERGWGGRRGSALCTRPAPTLCSTRLSANDRQKAAADAWIKQVIDGDTMSKATGLLEQQAPRPTARPTARATARATHQPMPRMHSQPATRLSQVALFGECVLSEDSTPSKCQQLDEALAELQQAIETCRVDRQEDCDTEVVASKLKEDKVPEVPAPKPSSGAKRRAVKNVLHMLTLNLFKTRLSPYQALAYYSNLPRSLPSFDVTHSRCRTTGRLLVDMHMHMHTMCTRVACRRAGGLHVCMHACACTFNRPPHATTAGGVLPRSSGGGGPRPQGRVAGRPRGPAQAGRRARRDHPERRRQRPAFLAWAGEQVGRVAGAPQEVNFLPNTRRRGCTLYLFTSDLIFPDHIRYLNAPPRPACAPHTFVSRDVLARTHARRQSPAKTHMP